MPSRKKKEEESSESYYSSSASYYSSSSSSTPVKKKKKSSSKKGKKATSKKSSKSKRRSSSSKKASSKKSKKRSRSSSKSGKKAKKRVRKVKGQPKNVHTAYIFFTSEKRQELKEKHPELSFGDISKRLGQMWKEATEDEKKKYHKMNLEDKKRFDAEMAIWKKDHPTKSSESESSSEEPKKKKKKKQPRHPDEPKRPPNSFLLYSQEHRGEVKAEFDANADEKPTQTINQVLGQRWKDLDEDEKKVYIDRAKDLMADYQKKMEVFKENHPELDNSKVAPVKKTKKASSSASYYSSSSSE